MTPAEMAGEVARIRGLLVSSHRLAGDRPTVSAGQLADALTRAAHLGKLLGREPWCTAEGMVEWTAYLAAQLAAVPKALLDNDGNHRTAQVDFDRSVRLLGIVEQELRRLADTLGTAA